MIVSGISLVLEGGGMRGMFSAGVFEAFMQKNLVFPHIVGVSAGACNIVSYMSGQPFRTRRIIQNYVGDKRYCSLNNWLKTRSLFGFDFILNDLPRNLLPFDYEAFGKYPGDLYVGTTDVVTGQPVWYTQKDMDKDFLPLRASASLPFFAPVVTIGTHKLLDGAIAEPIPISKAIADGYHKFVIVLTRNAGYRKKRPVPQYLLRLVYKHYPKLLELMAKRPDLYNDQLAFVEQLEKAGAAVIIRPTEPLTIGRLDQKPEQLLKLHDHGVECGLAKFHEIMQLYRK
ncbi:patatin family protein [uncultured Phascolarctobacterium sp.]|uniref:patatin-like phospholipase family protein n=1 Tax=Phascolarctobacterium sp. TaxID=2049039 RepID=UPI0025F9FF82|nr:patatin family protein [uncultured Phascolarctobacterium sp.]